MRKPFKYDNSKTVEENRLEVLDDTVAYYSKDVKRLNYTHMREIRYSPKHTGKQGISEGCSIGRLMPPELQEQLDEKAVFFIGVPPNDIHAFSQLPKDLQKLGLKFIISLQWLHDHHVNWTKNGLSQTGKNIVAEIKSNYCN